MPAFVIVLVHPDGQTQFTDEALASAAVLFVCKPCTQRRLAYVPDAAGTMTEIDCGQQPAHALQATLPRGTYVLRFETYDAARAWYAAHKADVDLGAVYLFDATDAPAPA